MRPGRFWGAIVGVLASLLAGVALVQAETPPVAYVDLRYSLARRGLDKDYLNRTFADPRNAFLPDVVRKIAYLKKETPDIYQKFLRPEVVALGRNYLAEHRRDLGRAEARYGVAPEVIVAILTVESGLGNITGRYPVFNVFASLAVMDTPEVIRELDLSPALKDRLKKKAAWARQELQAFLDYCYSHKLDPFSYNGSWAGAMGFCQFLPSSLRSCGVDGDGKGWVDLFTHTDAIFSIACYLHKCGFQRRNQSTWRRAVYGYNHSDAYVDTVITLANWY
jgi:membrane-bound lytic murein transglycosylase B